MRIRSLHAQHRVGRVNVTPMIDVVMVMIVFYLIVGKLAADRRAEVPLPRTDAGRTEAAQDPLVINVGNEGGTAVIEGLEVPVDRIADVVRERIGLHPGLIVQIRGARWLPYAAIEPVINGCRSAGVRTVRLVTERAS